MSPKLAPSASTLILVTTVVVLLAVHDARAETKKYSAQFDDLDVSAILSNEEERNRYYACFMDTGPCHTEAAVFFKSKAPEAVVTSCRYCTDKQLMMFEQIVSWFVDNAPQQWNILIEKQIQDARKQGLHP